MSSRSRWLRWVSSLPAIDPATCGPRLRYIRAESDVRRARSCVVESWDSDSRARYQARADDELTSVVSGGKS